MALKFLGVSGSLRLGSFSRRAVELTLEAARENDAETRLLDLGIAELPMFRPGETVSSEVVRDVADAVTWADAFLLATPDYHGSMSGAMKNFLDYHWEELAGKLFGYICASHEKGLTAMDQMRTAVRQCYGWSLPYGVSIHGDHDFDATGTLTNARVASRLRMLARDLTVYGQLLRGQFRRDLIDQTADTFATRFGH
ncbi:MAG: NADPH-dependent FMN reductase [Isosphaeraceae bacterium]